LGASGVDWAAQTVGMIGCVGTVTGKLISHKAKNSCCFLDKLVTEMLEMSLSFVLESQMQ